MLWFCKLFRFLLADESLKRVLYNGTLLWYEVSFTHAAGAIQRVAGCRAKRGAPRNCGWCTASAEVAPRNRGRCTGAAKLAPKNRPRCTNAAEPTPIKCGRCTKHRRSAPRKTSWCTAAFRTSSSERYTRPTFSAHTRQHWYAPGLFSARTPTSRRRTPALPSASQRR